MTHLVPVLRPVLGSPFRRTSLYRAAGEMPSWHIAPARTGNVNDLITGSNIITFSNSSPAWGFNSSGVLVQPTANAPFIEYDPATGSSLGWRLWGAVTNGHIYTEDFTNSAWTKLGCSMSANVGPSPDGGTNADGLVESVGVSEAHGFRRGYSFVSGTQITFSVFVSKGSRDFARIIPTGVAFGGTSTFANFDLTLGTVTTANNCTAQVQSCPNGILRLSITATPTVTTTGNITYHSALVDNASVYIGDGSTAAYFWGAQANTGPLAPYVPATGAVTASSTADVASILSWASANNIRSAYIRGRTTASGTLGLLSGNDNSSSNRIEAITSSTDPRLQVTTSGSSVANINGGTIVANTPFRMAMRFDTDSYALSIDGGAVVNDNSGARPTIDRWLMGRTQAGNYANGYIEEIALFSGVLSDARLIAMAAS